MDTLNHDILGDPARLTAEFTANGLDLRPEEAEKFWRLHELLVRRNADGDLTRVHGFRNLVLKHYVDGALAAKIIRPEGLTMDLGTGAGFPGLPLAILRPEWKLLLAEPRGRRLAFMEEAVELLGLTNVEFYPHKVGPRFDRAVDNFITRDFEPAPESLARAALIIPPGGRVYLMKGAGVDVELREARALPEWSQFELEDDRAYSFDQGRIKRRLITWRKKAGASRPALVSPHRVVEIASRENPRYKVWLKSLSGRGLKKSGQAIISGRTFVAEILADHPERVAGLIARRPTDLEGFIISPEIAIYLTRPELFPALDIFGAGPPLLLLDLPALPAWDGRLAEGLTVFLPFQDPGNLGTAIRTGAALGARVVLLKEAANPWHPKSLRAAGPAVLRAGLYEGPGLADLAALDEPNLLALSPAGPSLLAEPLPDRCGFVFGIEGPGLGPDWPAARRRSIPMREGVESLNAAAALAVSLGVWLAQKRYGEVCCGPPTSGTISHPNSGCSS